MDDKAASSDLESDEAALTPARQRYWCATTIASTATGMGWTETSPTGVDTDAEIDVRPRRRPSTRPSAVTLATDVSLDE